MSSTPRIRCTALLLLAATAYQLGGSPCGCLEHCGWVQAWLQVSGETADTDGDEDGVESHDCDHAAAMTATRADRVASPDAESAGESRGAETVLASANVLVAGRWDATNDDAAPPVRAQLQVFRI